MEPLRPTPSARGVRLRVHPAAATFGETTGQHHRSGDVARGQAAPAPQQEEHDLRLVDAIGSTVSGQQREQPTRLTIGARFFGDLRMDVGGPPRALGQGTPGRAQGGLAAELLG